MPTIQIDGINYVPTPTPPPIQIIIAQRGWIFVGRTRIDGEQITISNAATIRRWGTSKGLGEIAANGPTSATVLDECGTVRIHALAVVAAIDCEASQWPGR